ncbi:MAG: Membrane protein metalloendopeptidase [Candidatus Falkowbacteria bacterium GW2011_GWC2_38_22]|uniref:Membrane protein metalloendopeptidase n=1 Tax=Candidatus Falkowbacteria bacterium GW2011_GWE1_38_31 TaxID=1618638 RepID=A0A0G0JTZ9_9BACT|nr:MAG: Membrane protein metalloendopeptidase [Candidatus Falkowbacteria bacterium GW2011_GWF2_38_1205]KKQ62133.1 MAG: Membrane protein metalloendopeptidase [Candidatus Falkowbacteria bacterium GW2011_GWC2_38_22]KKQ64283.1 MAG: Membrane protein metalloendopeptidase [Candidatus Falkowbacteria bacterium GW2011_GWF1_38_22]KKQ66260.1 MAG: Membrane protein metalloendopeptidase [Candidatus Falkowbacteria bacterium GW2011_GWE2_38_254]KKQ70988.1 MAG: Membrane protein metalloendopeptidase [Candidatus Fa
MPEKKYKKITKLISVTMCLLFFLSFSASVYSQDDEASVINREVKMINEDISDKKNQVKKIQDKQAEYEALIKQKQQEKSSLNNQLSLLDNRLAKSELDIELVETEIGRIELEIQKTNLEIESRNKDILKNKDQIADVLRLIQKRDNVNTLEIMLLNSSLSEFLTQIKYLEDINESLDESLQDVEKLKRDLEKEQKTLARKNDEMNKFKTELNEKKAKLAAEKDNKITILGQVGQTEKEYQRLLAKAKKEQEDAAAEIASMEKLVRAKLASLDKEKMEFNANGMVWPVTKNVITAYFHDPDYPFRNIFEHPAVDIRAKQGSTLKAAASGYVARVKSDGSANYGYIMLIHGDGLSTVYGHVSKSYVAEDEYVVQGQAIGLSGGLPGTPGSGRLTTGSHLHFEVRLNGIPVDPLSYLP